MANPITSFIRDVFKTTGKILRTTLLLLSVAILLLMIIVAIMTPLQQWSGSSALDSKTTLVRKEGEGTDKIVILKASGLVLLDTSTELFSSSTDRITPAQFQTFFKEVQDDPSAKAVVIDLNSPGGSPVASDRIYEQIKAFRDKTKIPVVVAMGDLAASGGYYISAAADFIVANPATITGSIGVILESYNLEALYEKIGVQKRTFKQGEYKDILSESREITKEEAEIIDSLNKNTYDLFVARVADGRKMSEDEVRTLANGRVYSGRQAKDARLVDSLGNIDEAIYQAKSLANVSQFQVVEYQSGSFWEDLFGQINSQWSPQALLTSLLSLPSLIERR